MNNHRLLFSTRTFFSGLLLFIALFLAMPQNMAAQDEFKSVDESEFSSTDSTSDEFSAVSDDEFSEFTEDTEGGVDCSVSCTQTCQKTIERFWWIIGILIATVVAGFMVRFGFTRNLRGLFLLASLLIIGFYKGACTGCPINGIQNIFLGVFGYLDEWRELFWFIAIIPITYLFGKVWCGWICHLGALQEFIYLPGRFKVFRKPHIVLIGKIMRTVLLAALIIQIAIMGTKYWCSIDPFIQIFDFKGFAGYLAEVETFDTGLWITITLTALLLVTSVISFRPFCRFACPIGLILGWVAYIPGASVLGIKGKCASCKMCNGACNIDAITRKEKKSILDNQECIACGDCMDACPQGGLSFVRKGRKHSVKVDCTNSCGQE
jgi:ferredoxin